MRAIIKPTQQNRINKYFLLQEQQIQLTTRNQIVISEND